MSHEAYQPPTLIPQPARDGNNPSFHADGTTNPSSSTTTTTTNKPTTYVCGDCNAKVPIRRGDAIRCKDCGYRVLYKERTNRMVQFEAR